MGNGGGPSLRRRGAGTDAGDGEVGALLAEAGVRAAMGADVCGECGRGTVFFGGWLEGLLGHADWIGELGLLLYCSG